MKIHLVTCDNEKFLVKSHTKAGAEKFVARKFRPVATAVVPTQDELVAALKSGLEIEDATNSPQASIPEPSQAPDMAGLAS